MLLAACSASSSAWRASSSRARAASMASGCRADLGDGGDVVTEGGDPVGERSASGEGPARRRRARRRSKALDTSWICVGSTGASPLSSSSRRVWTRARRLAGAPRPPAAPWRSAPPARPCRSVPCRSVPCARHPAARAAFTSALTRASSACRGFGFGDRVGIESRAGLVEPCGQLRAEDRSVSWWRVRTSRVAASTSDRRAVGRSPPHERTRPAGDAAGVAAHRSDRAAP